MSCRCGHEIDHATEQLACLDCGAACCPACAVALESTSYCRRCATSLLGLVPAVGDGDFGVF